MRFDGSHGEIDDLLEGCIHIWTRGNAPNSHACKDLPSRAARKSSKFSREKYNFPTLIKFNKNRLQAVDHLRRRQCKID